MIHRFKDFNIAYHVTRRKNLDSIMKKGLIPNVPEDYGMNGDEKGIYLFKTYDDMENALYNWLGERIDEIEEETGEEYDEVALKIDITGLNLIDTVEYEWLSKDMILPDRIIEILEI